MKKEDKNRKPELSDFIKYQKGEMTDLQRNAFERILQKDTFAEEAESGFSEISPEEVKSDLELLEKNLKARSVKRRRMIYYRIAASVAVLMLISSVYILTERNRSKENKFEIAFNQTPFEIPESKAITVPEIVTSPKKLLSPAPVVEKKKAARGSEVQSIAVSQADELASAGEVATENISRAEISKDDVNLIADSIKMEPMDLLAASDTEVQDEVYPAAQELNEVVVIGYGVSKRSKEAAGVAAADYKTKNEDIGYVSASPVDGKESFDKYIEGNIRKPALLQMGERAIVVVSFTVTSSGVIENIKVIRSQGQEYSDEAMRLIKEGPPWKPAEENGKKIDEEVRVRIVFK